MLLIGNGRVITRDPDRPYLENGAVVTEGAKIIAVGEDGVLRKTYPDARYVDAAGGVIMPGLINAHTHIYSGLARGLTIDGYNPTNFYEMLDGMWWAIDRQLTLDGTRASAYATILDCIRNGVTTIFDHHASFGEIPGSLFAIRDVAKEYAAGIMRRLREHEYNPELMRLYVVGGGGCLIRNFADYDPERVTINDDICATAKGYERLAQWKLEGQV